MNEVFKLLTRIFEELPTSRRFFPVEQNDSVGETEALDFSEHYVASPLK